jgi:23S rRNA (cytosine1962-C5)-methyltransferase
VKTARQPASHSASYTPRLHLRVSAAAEAAIRAGHPWVFDESLREQNRKGELGELAVIYDKKDCFLAIGLFDPASPLRVRILHVGKPLAIDRDWWQARLRQAVARREGLLDSQTTGYRLVHGENDGWPGLVLDRYDTTLVVKLYTAAWLPRLEEVAGLIAEELKPRRLVLRLSRNIQDTAEREFGVFDGQTGIGQVGKGEKGKGSERAALTHPPTHGPDDSPAIVTFLETGLRFEAEVVRGQKTGFFLDQRENRRLVESLAGGCDVLNLFSFTGGFSVYAARGGAKTVTDLDISSHALEGGRRNFALNDSHPAVMACRRVAVQADAFQWLKAAPTQKFDLIVVDPPSLAKREAERARAIGAYAQLARQAILRLRPGGVLVSSSCSAHVSAAEFFAVVRRAARDSQRRFVELQTTAHPLDHPATFKEAEYLKCIYLRF